MQEEQKQNYQQVNDRLKEIVDLVSDEEIDLDAALDLLEEAVALGTRASALLEEDIIAHDAEASNEEASHAEAFDGKASSDGVAKVQE